MIYDLTFICSHGRTATKWVTAALDCHPDIAAAHGPVSPPLFPDAQTPHEVALSRGWEANAFHAMSLDAMAAEMTSASPKRFKARVHAINAYQLVEKVKAERPLARVNAVNLVRHPITRVASFQNSWWGDWNFSHKLQHHMTDHYHRDPIVRELLAAMEAHGFAEPPDMREKLFLCAISYLARDMQDFALGLPTFTHEQLTSDIENWVAFLRAAFGPTLEISHAHLNNVKSLAARNVSGSEGRSSMEVHALWAPWQKFAFRHFALTYHVASAYRPFGYIVEP